VNQIGIYAVILAVGALMWVLIRKPRIPRSMMWTIAVLLFVTLLYVLTRRT